MKIGTSSSSPRSSSFRNLLLDTFSNHSRSKKNKKTKKEKKGHNDGVPECIDIGSSHSSSSSKGSTTKQQRKEEPQQQQQQQERDIETTPPKRQQPPKSPTQRKTDLTSGSVMRAIVVKDTKITPVGLTLWDVYGDGQPPRIYDIVPESAAYRTKLEPGFVVEAISYSHKETGLVDLHFADEYYTASYFKSNGQSTKDVVTLEEVQTILAEAPAGPLMVRARVA